MDPALPEPVPVAPRSPTPDFLTVDEAAGLLRVNRNTLYQAIEAGRIPGVVRIGRTIRLSRRLLLDCELGNGPVTLKEKQ